MDSDTSKFVNLTVSDDIFTYGTFARADLVETQQ